MKRPVALLISLVLVVFSIGCVRTLRLRMVDESTGRPVASVHTSMSQFRADMLHSPGELGPVNLPSSDDNGMIIVRGFHKSLWLSQFTFSCRGYLTSYGQYNGNRFRFSTQVTNSDVYPVGTPFANVFALQKPVEFSTPSDGCFLIPLKRKLNGNR